MYWKGNVMKKEMVKDSKALKEKARNKLKSEFEHAKDKLFAEKVIEYLLKRCDEDMGVVEDVLLEHKTWKKCYGYIYKKAREQAQGNQCVCIDDPVVYEWAEDYFHKDDKAEEESKAKATKQKKNTEPIKVSNEKKEIKAPIRENVLEEKKKVRNKQGDNLEGQMSIFDLGL